MRTQFVTTFLSSVILLLGPRELARHRGGYSTSIMILESFFELKLDLLILRNQLLLPGENHATLGTLLF